MPVVAQDLSTPIVLADASLALTRTLTRLARQRPMQLVVQQFPSLTLGLRELDRLEVTGQWAAATVLATALLEAGADITPLEGRLAHCAAQTMLSEISEADRFGKDMSDRHLPVNKPRLYAQMRMFSRAAAAAAQLTWDAVDVYHYLVQSAVRRSGQKVLESVVQEAFTTASGLLTEFPTQWQQDSARGITRHIDSVEAMEALKIEFADAYLGMGQESGAGAAVAARRFETALVALRAAAAL